MGATLPPLGDSTQRQIQLSRVKNSAAPVERTSTSESACLLKRLGVLLDKNHYTGKAAGCDSVAFLCSAFFKYDIYRELYLYVGASEWKRYGTRLAVEL